MWLLERNKANETSTLFFLIHPVSALMAYFILGEQFSYLDFFNCSAKLEPIEPVAPKIRYLAFILIKINFYFFLV